VPSSPWPLPAAPAYADDPERVKFYTVRASYQGAPESLPRIAERFLGTTDRAGDIFPAQRRPQAAGRA
jgi:hypothetical protein